MATRITSAILWFVAVSWATNFASTFIGLAAGIGYVAALAVASFIALDPLNVLWRVPLEDAAQVEEPRTDLDRARQGT